jgi:hypothetical protein
MPLPIYSPASHRKLMRLFAILSTFLLIMLIIISPSSLPSAIHSLFMDIAGVLSDPAFPNFDTMFLAWFPFLANLFLIISWACWDSINQRKTEQLE